MKSRDKVPFPKNKGNDPVEPAGEVLGRVLDGLKRKLEENGTKPQKIGSDILGEDGTLTFTPNDKRE